MDFLTTGLAQVINGLVLGNIYALLAAGLALVFGVANLINFAHGSVYMAGAYAGWFVITHLGLPLPVAIPVAIVVSALISMLVERFAVRPFQGSARVAPLLATLGAGMILDSAAERLFTPNPQSFPQLFPADRFQIFGVSLGWLDFVILGVTIVSALVLFFFLKFSRMGQAIRATAQDPEAAQQMGVRVNHVNSWVFGLAGALGGLAGILIGLYYNTITPSMGFQAGLKGFTACILGGLGNIPGAMAGGLILGIFESLGVGIFGSSVRSLVSFVLLLVALLLRPNGLFQSSKKHKAPEPLTGTFLPQVKPIKIPVWLGAILFVAAAVLPLVWSDPYILQILTNGWIYGVFAIALTLVSGTVGIISLGHAGLMAIGAYASSLLMLKAGLPFEAAFPLSGVITAILGTLLASPALRLKGHYIAIATLALGEIVSQIILNWSDLTQGPMGLTNIPVPRLWGHDFTSASDFYFLGLGLLLITAVILGLIIRSPLGRTLRSIREDETAAQALGVRVGAYKALAFGISGFFAGLAGALTAHMYSYINHETFNSSLSILGLTMVILGGLGNVAGAVVGALTLTALPEILRPIADFRWMIYGLVLLLALRYRPQGALGTV